MRVVGYGDNVVDRYVNKNRMFPGGNCINFAVYAKRAGAESAYLGAFGEDAEAELIRGALDKLGVSTDYCRAEPGSVTEHCDVELIDGDRVFCGEDERENLHGSLPLGEEELKYLAGFDLIHSGCYAETEDELQKLLGLGPLVAFDFSEEDEFRTEKYLNALCPVLDFALFSCENMTRGEIEKLLSRVSAKGVSYVLATMGMHGQLLYDGSRFYDGCVKTITPVDTMGAGDSFFTAFMVSMLRKGWQHGVRLGEDALQECFDYAADFAADNCLTEGAFGFGAAIEANGV